MSQRPDSPILAALYRRRRDDLVSLLLAHGADRSAVSDDGKTAASIALEHGHAALAERLTSR